MHSTNRTRHHMAAPVARDDSDRDSSSSSFSTVLDSRRSWISDISFGSSSSISVRSFCAADRLHHHHHQLKPHKANQAEWEAIRRLRAAAGHVRLDHFRLLRRLGSGDLGNVYLCQLRDPGGGAPTPGCLYAMKVVDREALAFRKKLQRAETEKEILRALDHPFLPTLYADFDAAHYSCLVMEFCPGGDLHVVRQRQPGRRFTISSAKFYAAETLLALEYLHMMGVVYRDLKPENVLVRDDGHIMLSDFDLSLKCDVVPKLMMQRLGAGAGKLAAKSAAKSSSCVPPMQPVLSCFYGGVGGGSRSKCDKRAKQRMPSPERESKEDEEEEENEKEDLDPELVAEPIAARSKSFVGTHEYLAPEVISGAGHGSAVDWWALGVFLYEMIYGRTPFKGEDNEKTLINIIKQPLGFPKTSSSLTTAKDMEDLLRAQDLITKLLVKNPKKRIGSTKGSAEIKKHDFFKGVSWALIRSVRPPEVPRDARRTRSTTPVPVVAQKLSKKARDEPYNIPHHIDYF
ncbi:protein kinase PINOID 2-like [Canna indica]|uniref:non-specific serine/threonine protein kinase n=1 Tax=Canna indica TaxID=4628 RepID=A0AAQ3QFM6_9LILI|nr:protein kinase PINOID 2-like [Canna indica]